MENSNLTAKERIQALSFHLGLSVRALAKLVGMSEATLYHITDESLGISARTAAKMCYQIEKQRGVIVNRDWLLTGKGQMIDENLSVAEGQPEQPTEAAEDFDWQSSEWRDKYYSLLEKYNDLQDRYMKLMERGHA